MKKATLLLFCITATYITAIAGNDKSITFDRLPSSSQQMIEKNFPNQSISLIKMESELSGKSYEVIFTNGNKVEFDRKGAWKEINCKFTELPQGVVPTKIKEHVNQHYPNTKITKIERKSRKRHEIKLSNNLEIEFDAQFQISDIDN